MVDKKLTVCFLLPSLSNVSPVNAAISLALGLKDKFNITLLFYDTIQNSDWEMHLESEGVSVSSLGYNGFKDFYKARRALKRIARDEDFNVVLSMLFRCDLLLSATPMKANKISSLRNMFRDEYRISYGSAIGNLFYKTHLHFISKLDVVVCMSDDMYDFFKPVLSDTRVDVKKIFNFLDEDRVENQLSTAKKKTPLVDRPYPTVVSVSSLILRKRIDLILEACNELYDEGECFYLDIVGDGPELDRLLLLAKTSCHGERFIRFLGHEKNPIKYLDLAHVFVMASDSEGVSRSLMEALYLNKICVVSNIPGNREFSKKSDGVFLFDSKESFKKSLLLSISSTSSSCLPIEYTRKNALHEYSSLFMTVCGSDIS